MPTSIPELIIYLGVLVGIGGLYLVGNAVFGFQREGGRRLVIFCFGAPCFLLSTGIVYHILCDLGVIDMNAVFGLLLCIPSSFLGAYMAYLSIFGSGESIRKVFSDFLGGL